MKYHAVLVQVVASLLLLSVHITASWLRASDTTRMIVRNCRIYSRTLSCVSPRFSSFRLLSSSPSGYNSASPSAYDPMQGNVHWKSYESKPLQRKFRIAEARNFDPVFDHSIENDLPEPFGIMTWESSFLMARILEEHFHHDDLRSQVVCDLGCGTGLTTLLCAHLGAKQVLALDYNPYSLRLAKMSFERFQRHNVSDFITPIAVDEISIRNTSQYSNDVVFQIFDMVKYEEALPKCDLLLLSDVMYTPEIGVAAAHRVYEAVSKYNAKVIVTDPGRIDATTFLNKLKELFAQNDKLAALVSQLCFVPMDVTTADFQGFYLRI